MSKRNRVTSILFNPIVLAPILKGVTYSTTLAAACFPKLFWIFAPIAAATGIGFYVMVGFAAFAPLVRRFRRLGRACRVGDFDQNGNCITRHDCWF